MDELKMLNNFPLIPPKNPSSQVLTMKINLSHMHGNQESEAGLE